jgi:hypothetical protein
MAIGTSVVRRLTQAAPEVHFGQQEKKDQRPQHVIVDGVHDDEDKGEDGGWKLAFGGESENDQLMCKRKGGSTYLISRTMRASVWLRFSDVRKLKRHRG